ncbi:MAG: type I polyketide synthase [Sciscionella sp.]
MTGIAVVGLAGRFPGATDVRQYWANLEAGRVSIATLARADLLADGAAETEVDDQWYVPARGMMDGAEFFDAAFFGITPKDAAMMDPQHRLLLQTAWEALESAGLLTNAPLGRIGVFAGSGFGYYLVNSVLKDPDVVRWQGLLAVVLGNEKDHLAAKIAYRLDLSGPAVTVQTACSTSLVAVHLACQSLRAGDSDVALAGGVCVPFPHCTGYVAEPGGILSPDGGCRPFDATAAGTVPGSGVGVVVLKRLADAARDGDLIYAVVKGSAINNDGNAKVGYTAPGVRGQVDVLSRAYANADVDPATIDDLEAHGTATEVGDAIELAALTEVFARRDQPCSLGSVKANIGHLDAAAGVAGFIKVVLALHHERIPPLAGLTRPRAELTEAAAPFVLDTTARKWTAAHARRGAVSSFGLGGTNAHVVLEEAPARAAFAPPLAPATALLTVSARTARELDAAKHRLAAHLAAAGDISVHDVALTLQSHRRHFPYRYAVAADDVADAVAGLTGPGGRHAHRRPSPVFLFPGQGAEFPGMAAGPYARYPSFRSDVDICAELAGPALGFDLREILLEPVAADKVHRTDVAQPALFVHEYALGRLLLSWGLRPAALAGHSVGEYAAACLAGELDLADALALVILRGALMQAAGPGRMLAALTSEAVAEQYLSAIGDLDVAAVNGPDNVVVAGTEAAIAALRARFDAEGIRHRLLPACRAFHSRMMTEAADRLGRAAAAYPAHARRIVVVSGVDGTLLPRGGSRDAGYWAGQVRAPVRFLQAVRAAMTVRDPVLVEVGPGKALTAAARGVSEAQDAVKIALQPGPDVTLLAAAGELWAAGANLRWDAVRQRRGGRGALPTYPVARNASWLHPVEAPRPEPPTPAAAEHDEPVLARITAVWLDLLGTADVRPESSFFDLGGESLLFVRLVARLQRRFGVELDVETLSRTPTPKAMAELVTAALERA